MWCHSFTAICTGIGCVTNKILQHLHLHKSVDSLFKSKIYKATHFSLSLSYVCVFPLFRMLNIHLKHRLQTMRWNMRRAYLMNTSAGFLKMVFSTLFSVHLHFFSSRRVFSELWAAQIEFDLILIFFCVFVLVDTFFSVTKVWALFRTWIGFFFSIFSVRNRILTWEETRDWDVKRKKNESHKWCNPNTIFQNAMNVNWCWRKHGTPHKMSMFCFREPWGNYQLLLMGVSTSKIELKYKQMIKETKRLNI